MPFAITLTNLAAEDGPKPLGALLDFAPGAMIWTFLAFGVGLIFMWKFVYGPITAALEERDTKVEDAIKAAEVARQEARWRRPRPSSPRRKPTPSAWWKTPRGACRRQRRGRA